MIDDEDILGPHFQHPIGEDDEPQISPSRFDTTERGSVTPATGVGTTDISRGGER